ncbi:MAG: family polymerase sigma factor [Rhodoglobus sp.]|jgi:RNA polymerase sigma-70 factor (ECF subfamily)|nr:family polymerase sigma factor [Rhodoglobus sp.]
MPHADIDSAATEFEIVRPRLFGIAYRMLGTVAEAEDVVQDAWIRWQGTDRSQVRSPQAFLSTVITRLAINASGSSRARHEVYTGHWLPEPVLTDGDPALGAERAEALELGLLLLLERLTPNERAVYLLREAFDYDFREIAEVLETSEANARQLARRARAHLEEHRSRRVEPAERDRLLRAFLSAAQSGRLDELEHLLAEDVVLYPDGGGVVPAARRPVVGRGRVRTIIEGGASNLTPDVSVTFVEANGELAAVMTRGGEVLALCSITAGRNGIDRIYFLLNPEKLGGVTPR